MKILIFGRGVISTQYGWVFENSGNDVSFYVRPGRKEYYGDKINLRIKDGRKKGQEQEVFTEWKINMIEEIPYDHDFDLIFISVKHIQLDSVVEVLKGKIGHASILIANNYWGHLSDIEEQFPKGRVIWGFPGAGGRYENNNILYGGFVNSFFLEDDSSKKCNYAEIQKLFRSSDIKLSYVKNMQSWLWGHFIMNAAMMDTARKAGAIKNIFDNKVYIRQLILLMRKMSKVIVARGERIDMLTNIIVSLPVWLSSILFKMLGSPSSLTGQIMLSIESENQPVASLDTAFANDVYAYMN